MLPDDPKEACTLLVKRGDKVIVQMEIDETQIKAVSAAGLGLAAPRNRKTKDAKTPVNITKAVK